MEEGSLIKEALDTIQKNRGGASNRLIIDVFLIETRRESTRVATFQQLIRLCTSLNESLVDNTYPWFSGGDGPVFGIHVTQGIPHVRGRCNYGPSVQDEWAMVAQIFSYREVALKVWDADDGHILLIESALELPEWVDEIGPVACEHRCWVIDGKVTLIRPQTVTEPKLSLMDALDCLKNKSLFLEQPLKVQKAIERRIAPVLPKAMNGVTHRAAVLLPRQIAHMMETTPSLLHSAIASFEQHSHADPPGKIEYQDLVWTTQCIGRTSYALLRNLETPIWQTTDYMPQVYKSAELNRMKRVSKVDSTPHLHHALQLGLRIVAGLDYALGLPSTNYDSSAEKKILGHWTALDLACGSDGMWLRQAWMAGPNQSTFDLTVFIACPIASVDLEFPFPITYPGKTLKDIIQKNLGKEPTKEISFSIPCASDVDNEEWMYLNEDENQLDTFLYSVGQEQLAQSESQEVMPTEAPTQDKPLDVLLNDFETFVAKESDVDGIVTDKSADNLNEPVNIDPKLFFNLLHKVLVSTPEEISNLTTAPSDDPYFSKDDYDMTSPDDEENEIRAMMEAMDLELKSTRENNVEIDNPQVAHEFQTLSGLLESLEASEGSSGPVRNMLSEMKENQ